MIGHWKIADWLILDSMFAHWIAAGLMMDFRWVDLELNRTQIEYLYSEHPHPRDLLELNELQQIAHRMIENVNHLNLEFINYKFLLSFSLYEFNDLFIHYHNAESTTATTTTPTISYDLCNDHHNTDHIQYGSRL